MATALEPVRFPIFTKLPLASILWVPVPAPVLMPVVPLKVPVAAVELRDTTMGFTLLPVTSIWLVVPWMVTAPVLEFRLVTPLPLAAQVVVVHRV